MRAAAIDLHTARAVARPRRRRIPAPVLAIGLWALLLVNGGLIVWLWLHGGGVSGVQGSADLFTSLGRITGLLGVYLALIQVLLLARLPPLERLVGFDRLTVWHRRNRPGLPVCSCSRTSSSITIGYAGSDQILGCRASSRAC